MMNETTMVKHIMDAFELLEDETDIILAKTAWQLSLKHVDNDFHRAEINDELKVQGVNCGYHQVSKMIDRMLELGLLDNAAVGAFYRCSWTCTTSSDIEISIVPAIDELSEDVLEAVMKAIAPFGNLVDVRSD